MGAVKGLLIDAMGRAAFVLIRVALLGVLQHRWWYPSVRVVLGVQGRWPVSTATVGTVATAGHLPHDAVTAMEQRAQLARDTDKMPNVWRWELSKHFFSPFFFHLPAFITTTAQVIALCFSPKIRNTSLLFTP